jgi:transposase
MATATSTELTDTQWRLILPLLPPKAHTGRPRAEDRKTLNGILWVLRTGARWADMPREYGAPSTAHVRLQIWAKQGVWESIWRKLLSCMNEQGKLNWSQAFLDGAFIPAKKGERR